MSDFLEELHTQYDGFMDDLEDKGFPQPRLLIPAIIVLLIAIAGVYTYTQLKAPGGATAMTANVLVLDSSNAPVAGATVILQDSSGSTVATTNTDANGNAVFNNANAAEAVSVSAQGFQPARQAVQTAVTINLEPTQAVPTTAPPVTIKVIDDQGAPVAGATVTISTTGHGGIDGTTGSLGTATLNLGSPLPDSATVTASKDGYQPPQTPQVVTNNTLAASNTDGSYITITLTPQQAQTTTGTVTVNISDNSGNPIDGVDVALLSQSTSSIMDEQNAQQGVAVFSKVAQGASFTVRVQDSTGTYAEYTSQDSYTLDSAAKTIQVALTKATQPQASQTLQLQVNDDSGAPVSGASITILHAGDNALVANGITTDANGLAQYALPAGQGFYVTAWMSGYLPAYAAGVKNGNTVKLVLTTENAGNYASMQVVTLERNATLPGATVSLYVNGVPGREGTYLGIDPQTSGADGTVQFHLPAAIDGKHYSVTARAIDGAKTGSATQTVQDGANFSINLYAPPAMLVIKTYDESTGRSVSGAIVTADFGNNTQAQCITAINGSCSMVLESGEQFTPTIGSASYMQLTLAPMTLTSGETRVLNASVYSLGALGAAKATFEGVFDDAGNPILEVQNAQSYHAHFRLDAPDSQLAGFYVRVGRSLSASDDFVTISGVNAADAPAVYYGTDHNPGTCEDLNATNDSQSGGDLGAKWAEFVFNSGFSGSKEFDVITKVANKATPGDTAEFD